MPKPSAGSPAAGRKSSRPGNPGDGAGNLRFLIGLARAFGGALLFALPMLMTMEMWSLGFYIDPLRLALFLLLVLPLLAALSFFAGFEETFSLKDDAVDAFAAYAVGFVTAGAVLLMFGILEPSMQAREIIGKVSLQAVPGSIGAMLAQTQLGGENKNGRSPEPGFAGWTFLMGVGALFVALNIAPTEEIVLISYRMTAWHGLALVIVSLVMLHAFVFAVRFHGQADLPAGTPWWSAFLRSTVVGYAVGLVISWYCLWTFGRLDGEPLFMSAMATIVLGFPAALGAAVARLIFSPSEQS